MAYDEDLAMRVRAELGTTGGITERKMFGGLSFLLHGNMACGVLGEELLVRVPPGEGPAALTEPGVREMDFTGRPMKGWLFVGAMGIASDEALRGWVRRTMDYAATLPSKTDGGGSGKRTMGKKRPPTGG